MEAALRFYAESLRLPIVKQGEAPARRAQVALVAGCASYLVLLQPTRDDSPFARHIAEPCAWLHAAPLCLQLLRRRVSGLAAV